MLISRFDALIMCRTATTKSEYLLVWCNVTREYATARAGESCLSMRRPGLRCSFRQERCYRHCDGHEARESNARAPSHVILWHDTDFYLCFGNKKDDWLGACYHTYCILYSTIRERHLIDSMPSTVHILQTLSIHLHSY